MIVRDSRGKIIYHTIEANGKINVYDGRHRLLGYCLNGVTRKSDGTFLAYGESVGLLVGYGNNR